MGRADSKPFIYFRCVMYLLLDDIAYVFLLFLPESISYSFVP